MAKFEFKFEGMEEYALRLSKLGDQTKEIAGKAIYAGAKIVADKVRKNIEGLPTVDFRTHGTSENPLDGITNLQKEGLEKGFGVSPMQEDSGYYNVKVGFDGYNAVKTQEYPQGQPNLLIARSVEGGTSFRQPHPFVAPAIRASKKAAEAKMKQVLEEEIDKIIE